jgi:hypothetical protein
MALFGRYFKAIFFSPYATFPLSLFPVLFSLERKTNHRRRRKVRLVVCMLAKINFECRKGLLLQRLYLVDILSTDRKYRPNIAVKISPLFL